ncbi:MAG TPA: sugar ABC transporter permease [Chloroflexota bacterium]|nr:sugar ABC transporter permease [Chloroflexota bacterium]
MTMIQSGQGGSPESSVIAALRVRRASQVSSWSRFARAATPYVYIAPFFIIFFAFFAYPVAYSFFVSLHSWSGQGAMKWVGWGNYNFVLGDNFFWLAIQTTAFIWLSVPIGLFLGLVIAVLWNRPRVHGRSVVLVLYLLPAVVSIVAISLVFKILYDSTAGPVDIFLQSIGLQAIPWLTDEFWARMGILFVRIWEIVGLAALFFGSSLQNIPQDYYDAAAVDGGGPIRQFFSITVPLLTRTILFLTVVNTLGALSLFAEPQLIMANGGPNNATATLGVYLLLKVQGLDFGTASAVSFLMTAIMMVVSIVLFLAARRWMRE